jgi:exodeoxyribonuclease VII large subunit
VAIHLSGLPGGGAHEGHRTGSPSPFSTLLRVGFTEPTGSPRPLVRSYRTVSPLPVRCPGATPSAVCSLWHFPAGRPDWPLASTLPSGVPTFLDPFPTEDYLRQDEPRPPSRLTVPFIVPQTCSGHATDRPRCPALVHALGWTGAVTRWFYPGAVPLGSQRAQPGWQGSDPEALSISDLYLRIDRALKRAVPGEVWVTGEVRSFNVSSRGICYIDLVDPIKAQDNATPVLKVVCWSGRWSRVRTTLDQLGITLDVGLVVRVRGEVQLYKPRGDISFILSELDTDALLGKVAAERARLIKALVDEDLFDRNRRLPVPKLPLRIGLVASPGTEGYRDFVGCLEVSGMAFLVQVVPTQVQGRRAAISVAAALQRLQSERCDVLVVVRGGGSKADLATFDAEPVARAIAGSDVPVWTGIGHTGDQSVADEVANRMFITPTECGQELAGLVAEFWRIGMEAGVIAGRAAGEHLSRSERSLDRKRHGMVTRARSQLDRHADRLVHRTHTLRGAVRGHIETNERQLTTTGAALARSAARSLRSGEESLSTRSQRLAALPDRRLEAEGLRVAQWRRLLGAYDYQHQLERGYSVTRDSAGAVVRSASGLAPGTRLFTRLFDGEVVSEVTDSGNDRTGNSGVSDVDRQHDEGKQ